MDESDNKMCAWLGRSAIGLVALVYVAMVGYSRMFLGAHSSNQVYLGLQVGTWVGVNAHLLKD